MIVVTLTSLELLFLCMLREVRIYATSFLFIFES